MTKEDVCCECNNREGISDHELFCTHCYRAICERCLPPGARELHTECQYDYDCYGSDSDFNDDDDDDDKKRKRKKGRKEDKKKRK